MTYGQARTVETQANGLRTNQENLFQFLLVTSLLFGPLLLFGCAGVITTTKQVTSAGASFQVSPTAVNFGQVVVGKQSTQTVSVTNTGGVSVNITQINVSNSQFGVTGITLPVALGVSQSGTFTIGVTPNAAGTVSGTLTVQGDTGSTPVVINLTATAVSAQPQSTLTLSPTSYNFGSIVDGQTKAQVFTLSNAGTDAITISQISVNGAGFSVSGLTIPATVSAGGNATFTVLFAPTAVGSVTGTVAIESNAANSPNVLSVSGTGTGATVTLSASPATLSFLGVNAGSSSSKTVTLTNTGSTSMTISQVAINAKDFAVSGIAVSTTLTAGENASMNVTFSPKTSEQLSGNITLTNSAGTSAVITVSGEGVQPALTVTPTTADFGNVTVGSPASQTFQITNSGTGTLTISQVGATGTGFSLETLALPINLGAGQLSNFNVQFSPPSAGADTGSVSIVSNALNSPAVIPISGTGVAATQKLTYSTTTISFGDVNSGSSSTQNVTLTNSGNSNVTVSKISESGAAFTLTGAGTPVTLPPGQSLTFGVVFDPTGAGSDSGTVSVTSTASDSAVTITLSGTGVQTSHSVTLSWNASTSTVSGYNVYRSTTSGSGYSKINSALVSGLTYEDSSVQGGTTYYYVATAVDSSGDESTDSNQATAVVP